MNMFIGIVAVVVLLLVFVFVRKPKAETKSRLGGRRQSVSKPDPAFHAVSLGFPKNACDAAKAMEGRRFLSTAAPKIPLPECDAVECKCRFVHHKDRRSGDDRRDPYGQGFGGVATGSYEEEKRKRGERREDPPDETF